MLAVRRYYGFRSLVCASWCSEKEKQVQKEKLRCLMFLGGHIIASRGDDTANNCIVSKKSTSPAVMAPRGWYSPMPWLALRRAPVSRTCHTYTNTHVRASCCLLLLGSCSCIAVGSGAATTAAYSLVLSHHLKKRKKKRTSPRHKKQRKQRTSGKVMFPNKLFSRRQFRAEKG